MYDFEPGEFFERYYLIALLGEGGMAEVYLAYDLEEARLVAVKFLTGLFATNPKAVARTRREGEIYRRFDHPCIVKVVDMRTTMGAPVFLALEFLRGEPLDDVMAESREPLAVPRVIRVLEDVASALNAAHRAEVVHRDVKPQNVVLGPRGRATILDFGIARAEDDLIDTQRGSIMGTMLYASPEQRTGEPVDHRCDIFGLGAVLYELLTLRRVIPLGTYEEMREASTDDLPPPSERNPAVPEVLDEICLKMLAQDPAARYQDLRSLLIELGLHRVNLPATEREALFGDEAEQALDEAQKAFREKDRARAQKLSLDLARAPHPGLEAEIFHHHAHVLAACGDAVQAIHYFQRARELRPEDQEIVIDLALHLLRLGKIDRAGEILKRLPSYMRGHLVVRGILDLIQALPSTPKAVRAGLSGKGRAESFHRAVQALA